MAAFVSGVLIVGHLQSGLSRLATPSFRKSASGMPSVWFTCRDDLDDLVVEMAVVGLGDLGQVVVGDRLAVLVERDLAGRRVELERAPTPRGTSPDCRTDRP